VISAGTSALFWVESFQLDNNNGKMKYLKEHDPHKLLTSSVKKLTKLRNLDNYTIKSVYFDFSRNLVYGGWVLG